MSFDADALYRLLPEVYRLRDETGALRALVSVLAEQAQVLEEDIRGLYDDLFIETCADWVVPYLGDLLGVELIHGLNPSLDLQRLRAVLAPRAQVANALRLRRRKGTAAALEQLASDVTGWRARVVELFRDVAVTQHQNHLRPTATNFKVTVNQAYDHATAFDRSQRTADVRPMGGRARPNLPNVAIYLFRERAQERARWPATPDPLSPRHFRFSLLGCDTALFHRELPEPELLHLAQREHVPGPIVAAAMNANLAAYYGPGRSLLLRQGGIDVMPAPGQTIDDLIEVADLAGPQWGAGPGTKYRIDPRRGRLIAPANVNNLEVTFHEGVMADLGGGPYDRGTNTAPDLTLARGQPWPNVSQGVLELSDAGPFVAVPIIQVAADQHLTIRAADGVFAQLQAAPLRIQGLGPNARVTLSGLRIAGYLQVEGALAELNLDDCTLIPGRTVDRAGAPQQVGQASLIITAPNLTVRLTRCILGLITPRLDSTLTLDASILDAGSPDDVACGGPVGQLSLRACTVIGRIWAQRLDRVTDSVIWARGTLLIEPVRVERLQEGQVCFSYLPLAARAPARHHCLPDPAMDFEPMFDSLRYGSPAYARLSRDNPPELLSGASDGSELGVFHDLYQPQREANLRAQLAQYVRAGLDADLVFV